MFRKFLNCLVHFYKTRGKAELISFLTSMSAGFGLAFAALSIGEYVRLVSPEVQITFTSVILSLILAAGRSLLAGIIFAIVKRLVPAKWQEKFDVLFLRAGQKP